MVCCPIICKWHAILFGPRIHLINAMEAKLDLLQIVLGITYLHLGYVDAVPYSRDERAVTRSTPNRGLLLLLLDGVRWDQITSPHLTGFSRFIAGGVRAEHMEPVFPTNSFPNYFSISTGMYYFFLGTAVLLHIDWLWTFFDIHRPSVTSVYWQYII